MQDTADQLNLVLALTIDSSAMTMPGGVCGADAVISFSCEVDGLRCDGEISLRLSPAD